MNPKKVFYIMIGLTLVSVLAVFGALFFGNSLLAKQSYNLTENKANNTALEKQEASLTKAKRDIEKYQNLEKIIQTILPQDKDQARATREIINLAQESGFKIKTINFPTSNLGTKPAPVKNQDNSQAPAQAAPNPISQAKPVKDIKGVYSLEATVIPEGNVNYYQFIDFLSKLEKNRRTAQITSIKIDPAPNSAGDSQLTFTLTLNIFLKP